MAHFPILSGPLGLLWCLMLATGCTSVPEAPFPGERWPEATPAAMGVDAERMRSALDYLESECGADGLEQAMLIRHGRVIWQGDSVDVANNIYSSTKSFTSTLFGLLIEDGVVELDTRAAAIDPGLEALYPDAELRHFATMTSGYSAAGVSRWGEPSADWALDPFEVDTPLFAPGTAYAYWDEAQMMFGRLLTMAANQSLESLLAARIAEPIGIGPFTWWSEWEHEGVPLNNGCTGLELSASQLARFGYLFLHRGRWEGEQLVPETWVEAATRTQVGADLPVADTDRQATNGSGNYGYNWWTNGEVRPGRRALPDAPPGLYYASGFNNNMLFIIPEWDMVFVRTGMDGNPTKGKKVVYNAFFRQLGEALDP